MKILRRLVLLIVFILFAIIFAITILTIPFQYIISGKLDMPDRVIELFYGVRAKINPDNE